MEIRKRIFFVDTFFNNIKGKYANRFKFFRCTALSYLEADMELSFFAIYGGHGGIGEHKSKVAFLCVTNSMYFLKYDRLDLNCSPCKSL